MQERLAGQMPTHDNRAIAHESIDKNQRYRQIKEILADYGQLTAKEIAVEMQRRGYAPTSERNLSAPRLTELSIKGVVEPVGTKKCRYTGRNVSVFALREE